MKTAKLLGMLLPLVGLAVSAPVAALSWDTATTGIGLTAAGASIYCGSGGTLCNTTGTGLSGSVISMRAYSTPTATTTNTSPGESGNWLNAQIAIYGGNGVGISNTVSGGGGAVGETGTPQHAIDNYGVNDILVIDFGTNNWDVSSFSLGYACTMVTPATGSSCAGTTSVNVSAWVGGTSAINFNNVSFTGTGAAATLAGFTALNLSPDPGGSGIRTETPATSTLGRYLVISGDLAGYTDSFKVSGVVASQGSTGQAPIPGTVPLFALGLLALAFAYRRRLVPIRVAA